MPLSLSSYSQLSPFSLEGSAEEVGLGIDPGMPGLGLSLPIYKGSAEVGLKEG